VRSSLSFTEPLEVTIDRIEGDEQNREHEVDEQGDQRIHERQYDGHEGDRWSDRDPLTDLADQIGIEPADDEPALPCQIPPDDVAQRSTVR